MAGPLLWVRDNHEVRVLRKKSPVSWNHTSRCGPQIACKGRAAWYNCRAMAESNLQLIVEGVVRRARQQGSVSAGDIRTELKLAGVAESRWKDVAALAKPELRLRQGRYY